MKRTLVFGFVGLFLVSVTGCSSGPDSAMKEFIASMNDLAAAMEKKESPEKIKAAQDKMKAAEQKLDNLKLSDEDKKKLIEKHKGDLQAATERMGKAMFGQMGDQLGDMMNKMKDAKP